MFITFADAICFIFIFVLILILVFIAHDSLVLPDPRKHGQRHVILLILLALLSLRKPLQQRIEMRPLIRPQLRAAAGATTKLQRAAHMNRTHGALAETPHLRMRAKRKVELAQRDRAPYEAARELRDERL